VPDVLWRLPYPAAQEVWRHLSHRRELHVEALGVTDRIRKLGEYLASHRFGVGVKGCSEIGHMLGVFISTSLTQASAFF